MVIRQRWESGFEGSVMSIFKTIDKILLDKMGNPYEYLAVAGIVGTLTGLYMWGNSKKIKLMNSPGVAYRSFLKEEGVELTADGNFLGYGDDLETQRNQLIGRKRALDKFKEWEPSKAQRRASKIFLANIELYKGNTFFEERKKFREDARKFFTKKYHQKLQAPEDSQESV